MKLTSVFELLALSSLLVTLQCCSAAVERDLTFACGLDLNDCNAALAKAESRCGGNRVVPSPTAPTPTPPTAPTAPVAPGTLQVTGDDGVPQNAFPMNLCQGDCDEDSDCSGNLVCFQRDEDATARVPGCAGVPNPDGSDYCCDTSFAGCVSDEGPGDTPFGLPGIFGQLFAFLNPIFNIFDTIFGLGSRRRNLSEESNVEMDFNKNQGERKLFFGLINRECQALLQRCEENLEEFTCQPTNAPSRAPSMSPSKSAMPSPGPNPVPSQEPTITPKPTKQPTKRPTKRPTKAPTARPVRPPTAPPVNQMGMGKRRNYF